MQMTVSFASVLKKKIAVIAFQIMRETSLEAASPSLSSGLYQGMLCLLPIACVQKSVLSA